MLFDYVEGFDMSVVDEPFGIFDFDEDRESMEFDRSHSSQMRGALDDEMERLGNQGKEAERKFVTNTPWRMPKKRSAKAVGLQP